MAFEDHDIRVRSQLYAPSVTKLAELARLEERFPEHHIFWENQEGKGVRYLADRATADAQPYILITDDLAELRDELRDPDSKD